MYVKNDYIKSRSGFVTVSVSTNFLFHFPFCRLVSPESSIIDSVLLRKFSVNESNNMHRIIFKELWTVLVTWIIENFTRILKIGNFFRENKAYLTECCVPLLGHTKLNNQCCSDGSILNCDDAIFTSTQ